MSIRFEGERDQVRKAFVAVSRGLARASKATIEEAADRMLKRGRADIAAAGMSKEIVEGLQVSVYPKGSKVSIDSAVYVSHRLPFASVFEEGATIRGRPLLWVPLPGVPTTIGGRPTTARRYAAQNGKMFLIHGRNGRPILAQREGKRLVPLFVGLDSVTIRKRFHIAQIAAGIGAELPAIFESKVGEFT